MFYHDHAYGFTRLNVYGGEAAGYLLVRPGGRTALLADGADRRAEPSAAAPDLAHLIPLVIQDKTFVPSAAQLMPRILPGRNFGTTPGTAQRHRRSLVPARLHAEPEPE